MSECFECKGYCCKYVTVDIESPSDWEDYDEIRWYIIHKNVIVYKPEDEEDWKIEFRTPCEYLNKKKNICKQYKNRPDVCIEYITDECAKHEEMSSEGCEVYLESEEDLKKYMQGHVSDMVSLVFREH